MRPLILLAFALPALAAPVGTHPFRWITGEQLLRKLNSAGDAAEAVAYLKGVADATADRDWCYSKTRPGSAQLQSSVTDAIRSATANQAQGNAGALAVSAWRRAWPCPAQGCCHE